MKDEPARFLFVTCQWGAEGAVKSELGRQWPDWHLAYSRPGFLTFKLPDAANLTADFDLKSVFARSYGFSLGKVVGADPAEQARRVWELIEHRPVERIHVWQRDRAAPGEHEFEPHPTEVVADARKSLLAAAPRSIPWARNTENPRVGARAGESVLDCILVEPNEWWVGYHRARWWPSRWPGGMVPLDPPAELVSRAWLKMDEALRWAELPIEPGARCVEVGSAPGGASQALLARGLEVTGIDPAEMDPRILSHPRFTHIRRRVNQVRRREFRKARWLTVDMNVAPKYTLEVVQSICGHPEVNIRGMLLTLKLFEWKLADEIPDYLRQIRTWGYNIVRARQLEHSRQEVCVVAMQKPFRRKPLARRD
jgi:23S rRNA (cytidine2498-2'-O)-methyltransferase